jgi:hypothetical protein
MGYLQEILAELPSAQDAVSLAVRHLPPDLGPVTYGRTQ